MGLLDVSPEATASGDELLDDPMSEVDEDEEAESLAQALYIASFDELAEKHVQYDTAIWVFISLPLVLAWGVGIFMLLYLPFKRFVLQKDISSRKLYVTPEEIVYKVSRPSFIPFWGFTTIEKRVPLSLVIDIIIEQGCLQSVYGLHTFRVESIAHGTAAPVNELLVQGVSNPGILRKVIITEASKIILDADRIWKPTSEQFSMTTLNEGSISGSPSKSFKMTGSPSQTSMEHRRILPGNLLLHKLEEINKSVKVRTLSCNNIIPAYWTEHFKMGLVRNSQVHIVTTDAFNYSMCAFVRQALILHRRPRFDCALQQNSPTNLLS